MTKKTNKINKIKKNVRNTVRMILASQCAAAAYPAYATRIIMNHTASNDTLEASPSPDTNTFVMYGFGGDDNLFGGNNYDQIFGGPGVDNLFGKDGDDRLFGDAGDDQLSGEAGNDTLIGGAGNDILSGDAGDDTLDGGAGIDVVDYSATTSAFTFNINLNPDWGTATGAPFAAPYGLGTDFIKNIEGFNSGSNANDQLIVNISQTQTSPLPYISGIEKITFTGFDSGGVGTVDTVRIDFGDKRYNALGVASGAMTIDLTGFGSEDKLLIRAADGVVENSSNPAYDSNGAASIISQFSSSSTSSSIDSVQWKTNGDGTIKSSDASSNVFTIHLIGLIGTPLQDGSNFAFF